MLKAFKEFAVKGNMVDMAVGIIIGTAFGKVISSLVSDIIMPPIGLLLGKVDFTNLFINLGSNSYSTLTEAQEAGAPTLNYGLFINTLVDFIIIAFAVFMIIKALDRLKKPEPEAEPEEAPAVKTCPFCLSEIQEKAIRCAFCTSELAKKTKERLA